MRRQRRASVTCLLFLALLGLASCSEEDDAIVDPHGGDQGLFTITDSVATSLALDAGAVWADSVAGLTFSFPGGASGALTRGRLAEAPARPWPGGEGFYLRYDGSEPVAVHLPQVQQGVTVLLAYGSVFGARAGGLHAGWTARPVADSLSAPDGDTLVVYLAPPPAQTPADCEGGTGYWLYRFAPDDPIALDLEAGRSEARRLLAVWRDSLDAATRDRVTTRLRGDLAPQFFPDARYYTGFDHRCGAADPPAARIGLGDTYDAATVARQVGYYCTHLLMGDEAYRRVEAAAPFDPGFGRYQGQRRGTINDYAYFHEWLLRGAIDGAGDPAVPGDFFAPAIGRPEAVRQDIPALEGYGVLLLHALMRSDTTIVSLAGSPVTVPTVGFSYAELAAEVLAAGAADGDELRSAAAAALAARGIEDRLAPLAAATGWTYALATTVRDTSGARVSGARVYDQVASQGRTYTALGAPVISDEIGRLSAEHLFPGPSRLRVELPSDTFSVPLDCDWERATNAPISVSDLVPWRELDRLTKISFYLRLDFSRGPADTLEPLEIRASLILYAHQAQMSAHAIVREEPYAFSCSQPELKDCWTIDSLYAAYSLETGAIDAFRFRLYTDDEPPLLLRVAARPGLCASMSGCNRVYFARYQNATPGEIDAGLAVTVVDPSGRTLTATDLTAGTHALEVRAYRG